MTFSRKVNSCRRFILRRITRFIGGSGSRFPLALDRDSVVKVLVSRPNSRLGNLLLLSPLVQEIQVVFPQAKIDFFVRSGLIPVLYQNYENVGEVIQLPRKPFKELFAYVKVWLRLLRNDYDLVINVDKNSSSGRISTKLCRARYKIFGDEVSDLNQPDFAHMAKMPVYVLRKAICPENTDALVKPLNLKLNAAELKIGKDLVTSLTGNNAPVLALYTFATGEKCYSVSWWTEFYSMLREAFPEFNIVEVLPVENVSQIQFKAPHYYSRDIREMGAFMANTKVFITADCGIMHLASSVQTPTVGLFSITDMAKYKPYNSGSMTFNTNQVSKEVVIEEVKKFLKPLEISQ